MELEVPSAPSGGSTKCPDISVEELIELFPELDDKWETFSDDESDDLSIEDDDESGITIATLDELENGVFHSQISREKNGLDPEALKKAKKPRVEFGGGSICVYEVDMYEVYMMHGKKPNFHPVPRR
jgi:hypothetical protein